MYIYIYIYTHVYIYIYICVCASVCVLAYIHTYIQTDRQTDRQIDIRTCHFSLPEAKCPIRAEPRLEFIKKHSCTDQKSGMSQYGLAQRKWD